MKKILTIIISISLYFSSFPMGFANDQKLTPKQIEQVRQVMMKGYNTLVKWSDEEWEENFIKVANQLRKDELHDKAEAMEAMADPEVRETILDIYREKMNKLSENGIVFSGAAVLWLIYCLSDGFPKSDPSNDWQKGMIFLVFGVTGMITLICGLVVLGDDTIASEI